MLHNVKKPCWSTCIVSLSWPPNQSAFEQPAKKLRNVKEDRATTFLRIAKVSKSKKFSESIGHRKKILSTLPDAINSTAVEKNLLLLENKNSNYSAGPSKNQTLPRLKSNTVFWLGSLGSGGLWIFYLGG